MMIRSVLGSRASIGGVLGSGRGGAAAAWYLAGGVSAANCVAAYQPKGAASLAASYTNLANPGTYDASAPVAAPTFAAATGWTFNGTPYLATGIYPASSMSAICRFSDYATTTRYIFGADEGTRTFGIVPSQSGSAYYLNGTNPTRYVTGTAATGGVMAVTLNGGYLNGAEVTYAFNWSSSPMVRALLIGGVNASAPTLLLVGKIQAVAIYNVTLSAPQVAAISSAMSAL